MDPFRPSRLIVRSPKRRDQTEANESSDLEMNTDELMDEEGRPVTTADTSVERTLGNEGAGGQTPLSTGVSISEAEINGDLFYSSPHQQYILKMRLSEEETMESFRNVLQRIRKAMSRQRNINMDVQKGISELEELVDIMSDYRRSWKNAEAEKTRSKDLVGTVNTAENVGDGISTIAQKRISTSPAEMTRTMKLQRKTKRKIRESTKAGIEVVRKEAEEEKPPEREQAANGKRKRLKRVRERSDAIIVKPTEGYSYAEVLKNLKENVKPEELDVTIHTVRRTKTGAILVELEKGYRKERFCNAVKSSLGAVAEVRGIENRATIEIRDIEGFSIEEDILTAVKRTVELSGSEITVKLTSPNAWDQRRAFVSLPAKDANKLLKLERIKIGWVNCRIRHHEETRRCYRCFRRGHTQRECKGPDRNGMGLCIQCGEKGHTLKQCKKPPKCCLCLEEGRKSVDHIPGSRGCNAGEKQQ